MWLSSFVVVLPLILAPVCGAQSRIDFENIHNNNRFYHQAGELTWDDALEDYARRVVNQCSWHPRLAPDDTIYGFNRAVMPDEPEFGGIGLEVIILTNNLWYDQRQNYHYYATTNNGSDYDEPPMSEIGKWGNFTQMVWKDTEKFGCAVRKCDKGVMAPDREAYNIWCVYSPMGNVRGKFGENVFEFKVPE